MTLADVRDYIASLDRAGHVYMGKTPDKKDKSIGVYNSKHQHAYKTALGGPFLESYGVKYVTFLVHWNKSLRETENAAVGLLEVIQEAREVTVNESKIKFIQPLYDIQDVGTDDAGIFEMVIEAAVIYERKKGEKL